MNSNATRRVIHLTFQKCGSQWVRDVLTAAEIVAHSGVPLHPRSVNLWFEGWPIQPLGTLMGPIYNASYETWAGHRGEADQAVVVLRDPRDLAVSWVHSACFSHVLTPAMDLSRKMLLPMSQRGRMLWGIQQILLISKQFSSWANRSTTGQEYVTRYETLVGDPVGEFARITQFLRWQIPQSVLEGVVRRLSFSERSGRAPGEEDIFSHYRKGQPGDWRGHFDKDLGRLWESYLPGFLTLLGYEKDDLWFEALPENSHDDAPESKMSGLLDAVTLQSEIVRLREENAELRKGLHAWQMSGKEAQGKLPG